MYGVPFDHGGLVVSRLSVNRQARLAAPDDATSAAASLLARPRSAPAIRSGGGSVVGFSLVEPVET